jgi:hypothetical protein
VQEFREASRSRAHRTSTDLLWEGAEAYKNLKVAGARCIELGPERFSDREFRKVLERLFRQVEIYHSYRQRLLSINAEFKSAIAELTSLKKRAIKLAGQVPTHGERFDNIAKDMEEHIKAISSEQNIFGKDMYLALPDEMKKWYIDDKSPQIYIGNGLKRVLFSPPSELAKQETTLQKLKYPKTPQKYIDLDSALQVRSAGILKEYFADYPKVALSTISRLVVLMYICAKLVDKTGHLILPDQRKGRVFSVSAVDQKLRAAGF